MQAKIRNIGNSKGIIIPASLMTDIGLTDYADIVAKNQSIIITPITKRFRENWFTNYNPNNDIAVLDDINELPNEVEDWQW